MARRGLLVGLVLVLGLTGCGVSRSGTASDEGDAAAIATPATDFERKSPPSPNDASSPDGLVRDFLKASVGGGKAGVEQVKRFLNDRAKQAWHDAPNPDNPPMTVIRLVGAPSILAVTDGRTPVKVDYQVVGELSDQGRVDELDPGTQPGSMIFYVVADDENRSSLRIDEIAGGESGLMISDEALTEYYRSQPIYFWDAGYTALVPDLRYVPLTEPADVRAGRLVRWLGAGPSSWVKFGVTPLQLSPTPDPVVSSNGALVVKFSTGDTPADEDILRRLLFQLQWTLSTGTTPNVQIVVDDKVAEVKADPQEYRNFNRSSNYRGSGQRYDITTDRKVVPSPTTPSTPPVLAAAENQNVSAAAITLQGNLAAFVRTNQNNNRKFLQFVREGVPPVESKLGNLTEIGRPVFVPDTHDSVLVIANANGATNRLYAVSSVDGSYADVTRGGGIISFSVSPDGRRIAYVTTNGQVSVASLSVLNGITISTIFRPILSGQITASSVVWTSESWLAVAGTAPGGGPALWRVTADSVVGQNMSDTLKGIQVTDLVAYPQQVARPYTDVLGTSKDGGVYSFFNAPAQESLRAPFFAAG